MNAANFTQKLDQAPYKPKGLDNGQIPTIAVITNGHTQYPGGRNCCALYMDELGRPMEDMEFENLRSVEQIEKVAAFLRRRKPEVIGVAGSNAGTHRMVAELRSLVEDKNITVAGETEDERFPVEVCYVNDEVARLTPNPPSKKPEDLQTYCEALGRYLQSPLMEYANLKRGLLSVNFHPDQQFLPQDKLYQKLETAIVDMVNMVGVNINDALKSPTYVGTLLQYVSGLGPRKASGIFKIVGANVS